MTHFLSKRRARMMKWMDDNPNCLYSAGYDDVISDAQANMLLAGEFDDFSESVFETVTQWDDCGELWSYWESEFATEFGYDAWHDMPERLQEFAQENRTLDESAWLEDSIRNKHAHVTATLHKPPRKGHENYIFAPSNWTDRDGHMVPEDIARARYLMDAFGITYPKTKGDPMHEQFTRDIEVVYGGYDAEQLTVIGRVDLLEIYKSGKKPTHVTVGPEDADNLLFYDFQNGCGNMGSFRLTRTRTLPATLRVDGSYGYGVDSCYGFVGEVWRHPIRIEMKGGN